MVQYTKRTLSTGKASCRLLRTPYGGEEAKLIRTRPTVVKCETRRHSQAALSSSWTTVWEGEGLFQKRLSDFFLSVLLNLYLLVGDKMDSVVSIRSWLLKLGLRLTDPIVGKFATVQGASAVTLAAFDIRRTQHSVPLLSCAAARQSYARAWRRLRERWAPPEQGFFGFCFNPIDSPKMLLRSAEVSCSGEWVFPLVKGKKLGTVPTDCHWRPELAEVA